MQVNSSHAPLYINDHKKSMETSLSKVATGKNEQLDDATLALITNALGNDIGTLSQGLQNATDAVSMMQIADGVTQSLSSSANDLNTLAVASNNAALSSSDKATLTSQADAIKSSMQNSIDNAQFNGQNIFGNTMEFSLGKSTITADIGKLDINTIDSSSQKSIRDFMKSLQDVQSTIASTTNSLGSATNSILSQIGSLTSAKSQMSDSDIANEINNFSQQNILLNASLLSQAHLQTINASRVSQLLG